MCHTLDYVSRTWPCPQRLSRGLVIPWTELDDMSTAQAVLPVEVRIECRRVPKDSRVETRRIRSSNDCSFALGACPTHVATKFVLSDASSSLKLPPTICFTCPLCKSMHGRNMSSSRDTLTGRRKRNLRSNPKGCLGAA